MISTGAAIKLGFTQAASRWATGLFAVLASTAEVIAGVIALLAFFAWLNGGERTAPVAIAAAVAALLAARILLAFVHGGAIRQSAAWLKGLPSGTTLEEMFHAAPRSLAWFAWTLPIELLGALWKWLGLAALLWAYGRALATGAAGCSAALSLSMFTVLSLPLAIGWSALRRAALVAAVRDELGPFDAMARAAATLLARPGAHLAVLIVGLAGAFVAETMLSIFGSVLSPSELLALEPTLASQLGVGSLVAFAVALFELVILYGFTALETGPAPAPHPAAPAVALAA